MAPVVQPIEGIDPSTKHADLELILNPKDEFLYVMERKRNSISAYSISEIGSNQLFYLTDLTELAFSNQDCSFANTFTFNNTISFTVPSPQNMVTTLNSILSNRFKRYLYDDSLDRLFAEFLTPNERPTSYVYGTLSDGEIYLCVGTSLGNLILLKLFIYENEDMNIYICRELSSQIKSINLFSQTLLCCSDSDELLLMRFSREVVHTDLKKTDGRRERIIILKEISQSNIKKVDLPNKMLKIMPIIFLGNPQDQDELIAEFCNRIVCLILEHSQLILLDLATSSVIFEHRFGENMPVGLYLDRTSEFLHILFDNGGMDVFNLNLGNILAMIRLKLTQEQMGVADNPDALEFQMKLFNSCCFTYERCVNLSSHLLNLEELLKYYKAVFVDLRSYSKFTNNVLMNITSNGSIFQFFCQFYTNELISSHIEYPQLKKGAVLLKPNILDSEKKPRSKELEEAFHGGVSSLKDLNLLIELQNKQKEQEEKGESIPLEKIPLKLQNVLERNSFNLIKERLGEEPLKLLDLLEQKSLKAITTDLEDGSKPVFSLKEIIKMLTTLNYSNLDIFADSESQENCVILKKQLGKDTYFILNFYPPVYDPNVDSHKNKISAMLFPLGIDTQSEMEFKAAFGDGFPTIEYTIGTQGISEAFSFVLTENYLNIENNLSNLESPRRLSMVTIKRDIEIFTISRYVTTSIMLSIVSELIYILKKGYTKVQPLINSIRQVFFDRMSGEVKNYCQVSHKILTLLTLNDKLLASASSHFILNNIYDKKKIDPAVEFLDRPLMDTVAFFFIQAKLHQTFKEGEPLSVLGGISKFELFAISFLLFSLKIGARENVTIPMTKDDVIHMLVPLIE